MPFLTVEERGVLSELVLEEGNEFGPLTKTADELCDWLCVLSKVLCWLVVSEFLGSASTPPPADEAELSWRCVK